MNLTEIHDTLVQLMVTMSAAEGKMSDEELQQMSNIVRNFPVFKGYDDKRIFETARNCSEILQRNNGLEVILEQVKTKIPAHLYETAYSLAVEIAVADLRLEQEELRLLQMLADRLNLDRLSCAAIERGARARHMSI